MSKIYDIYKEQPTAIKGAIALVGTLVVGYAAFTVFGLLKKKTSELTDTNLVGNRKDLADVQRQGVKPSYSDSEFQAFAAQLHSAMDRIGTDTDAIYRVFGKMKNKADVLKLIEAYGKRPLWVSFLNTPDMNLFDSLSNELSGDELDKINKILKDKGINYQF